jgi:hypothetical protein
MLGRSLVRLAIGLRVEAELAGLVEGLGEPRPLVWLVEPHGYDRTAA